MSGLVDYAYSSDDDNDDDNLPSSSTSSEKKSGDLTCNLGILTMLPPPSPFIRKDTEIELEDAVKRKDWEIKLAKKAKKKFHRNEKRELKKKKRHKNIAEKGARKKNGKVVIQAFDALSKLTKDEFDDDRIKTTSANILPFSPSSSLLDILPQPKKKAISSTHVGVPRLFNSGSSKVNSNVQDALQSKGEIHPEQKQSDDESADELDFTDFFGLKSSENTEAGIKLSTLPLGPFLPPQDEKVQSYSDDTESVSGDNLASSIFEKIDDKEALNIIYSKDIVHSGGTLQNAAQAVKDIIDVNVDQALGPDVKATLLKNLHNKSLAEASIAHLSSIPRSKLGSDMVARRKHQITYLANMAVAREEQLAEEWSQNRQNKRIASQKYGF